MKTCKLKRIVYSKTFIGLLLLFILISGYSNYICDHITDHQRYDEIFRESIDQFDPKNSVFIDTTHHEALLYKYRTLINRKDSWIY